MRKAYTLAFVLFLAAPATQAGLPPNDHLDADAKRSEVQRLSERPPEPPPWEVVIHPGSGVITVR
jgi:hypothetical protein